MENEPDQRSRALCRSSSHADYLRSGINQLNARALRVSRPPLSPYCLSSFATTTDTTPQLLLYSYCTPLTETPGFPLRCLETVRVRPESRYSARPAILGDLPIINSTLERDSAERGSTLPYIIAHKTAVTLTDSDRLSRPSAHSLSDSRRGFSSRLERFPRSIALASRFVHRSLSNRIVFCIMRITPSKLDAMLRHSSEPRNRTIRLSRQLRIDFL